MSGLAKQKQYQYSDAESGHKYLRSYDSMTEVFEKYYDGKVGRLYEDNKPYKEMPDGTFVSHYRIGREGLRRAIRLVEDPTLYKRNDDKPIYIYNSLGELVGEVANRRILEAITNTTINAINIKMVYTCETTHFGKLRYQYKK